MFKDIKEIMNRIRKEIGEIKKKQKEAFRVKKYMKNNQ